MFDLVWRGPFASAELSALHASGFGGTAAAKDWRAQVERHSLGWVVARDAPGVLVGFVNVAWDGGEHAFVVDTLVAPAARRGGLGTALVAAAVDGARRAGCTWLHVDFEERLGGFYRDSCGFPDAAGVLRL